MATLTQGWDTVCESAEVQGTRIVVQRKDLEAEDDSQDPNFFDSDYSIAASTGMVVWEGSWVLIELLRDRPTRLLREGLHVKATEQLDVCLEDADLATACVADRADAAHQLIFERRGGADERRHHLLGPALNGEAEIHLDVREAAAGQRNGHHL